MQCSRSSYLTLTNIVLVAVMLLLASPSYSQEYSGHLSLQQQLDRIEELDSSSPKEALKLAQALERQYPNNKEVIIWLSRLYAQFSNVDEALIYANRATQFKLTPTEQMHVQMGFAIYYYFKVDKPNTFKHIDLAVKAAMLSESATNIVRALSFRSSIYSSFNLTHQAMEDISTIYESIDFVTEPDVLSSFYNALCAVYLLTNQFEGAVEAQLKSIEFMTPTQNQQQLSVLHYNLADIYWQMDDFDAALKSYSDSLEFSKNSGDTVGESYAYMGQGKSHLKQGNYQQALNPLKKAESFFSNTDDTVNIVETNSHLAQIYLNLRQFSEAKAALEK
ncbi:MAG: tetratricopeptide repeat protein, partial [Gammaproteobacteria bacterium]|nr:tetratricopeptide repeat protein [Gammaproteobacteria bacterium]